MRTPSHSTRQFRVRSFSVRSFRIPRPILLPTLAAVVMLGAVGCSSDRSDNAAVTTSPSGDTSVSSTVGNVSNDGTVSNDGNSVVAPVFTPGPCLADFAQSVRKVDCGTVEVSQNRQDPARGSVRLSVAVIRGADDSSTAPLVFLPGGPGDSALTTLAGLLQEEEAASAFFGPRDWVVYDPRGTGASEPKVACPVTDDLPAIEQIATAKACAERLSASGIDLTTYNTTTLAADARDVRVALGFDRWDVYGVSYGTRVALELMRSDPAGLRGVVLDGPYPTTQGFNDSLDDRPTDAFEQLFADCAADATCGSTFPDLSGRVVAMIDRLNASPVTVDGFRFTGDFAIIVAARALYQYTPGDFLAPGVPRALSMAADGDFGPLVELAQANFGTDESSAGTAEEDTTVGVGRAVQCHDEIPFLDRALAKSQESQYPFGAVQARYDGNIEFDMCPVFGAGTADPSFRTPVTSDVPTLVLTGTYDPTTPTAWADETVATLKRAQLVRFAGVGHVIITTGLCPLQMMQQFLESPTEPVDRSCADDYRPEFTVEAE